MGLRGFDRNWTGEYPENLNCSQMDSIIYWAKKAEWAECAQQKRKVTRRRKEETKMKIRAKSNKLIMSASSRVIFKTFLFLVLLTIYCFILRDFIKKPTESILEFVIISILMVAVVLFSLFRNMFVSSLIIDSDGIKEKWLFVITRKRLLWSDVEDYYFEPYSPYNRIAGFPFKRVVFESRNAHGKIERLKSPYYSVRFSDEYEKLVDDFCSVRRGHFEDSCCFSENCISGISKAGISLSTGSFIDFKECARNYKQAKGGSGNCVGDRDITNLSFTFYTSPKTVTIRFSEKNELIGWISRNNARQRFIKFKNQLADFGYRTFDLS